MCTNSCVHRASSVSTTSHQRKSCTLRQLCFEFITPAPVVYPNSPRRSCDLQSCGTFVQDGRDRSSKKGVAFYGPYAHASHSSAQADAQTIEYILMNAIDPITLMNVTWVQAVRRHLHVCARQQALPHTVTPSCSIGGASGVSLCILLCDLDDVGSWAA